MTLPRLWLVIPAAGVGQRMQAECPKQYLKLDGRYIIDITVSRVLSQDDFAGCMVALASRDRWWPDTESASDQRVLTCEGGRERADSVLAALNALADRAQAEDWVLVHDAARPCLHPDDLERLIRKLQAHPVGGLLAARVADTLKRADAREGETVEQTVDRSRLWRALTPQMFRFNVLREALDAALASSLSVTDESSAVEFSGKMPVLVEGRSDNIKVTVPPDLALARFILGQM